MSRVFTPRRMNALEDQVREFCAGCLDPLVGADRFDFVADLGAEMPMRVIGMLLGIPEADQTAVRDKSDAFLRTEAGKPMEVQQDAIAERRDVRRVRRLAGAAPVRRPDDGAAQRRVRGRDRHDPHAQPRRGAHLHAGARRGGQRDHRPADRLAGQGARRAPRPAPRARRGPLAHPERDRGDAALRADRPAHRPVRRARRRVLRHDGARPAARCCCSSARRTATSGATTTPIASTSTATSASTSRSATACTSAWARRSPGSRGGSRSTRCSTASPTGRSTYDNAELAPTSTVRGWETMPVFVG